MTKEEMEVRIQELEKENENLRKVLCTYEEEYIDDEAEREAYVNRIVAERLAKEDEENDRRAAEDPDFAEELRQIRYLESRYDDDYGW